MASDNIERSAGKHAAAPKPLTKREQKRAEKAAQKAAEDAAKQAKRAAKAAEKAAKKGGGVVAPAASATAHTVPAANVAAAAAAASAANANSAAVTAEILPVEGAAAPTAAANPLENLPRTMPEPSANAAAERINAGGVSDAGGFVPAGMGGASGQFGQFEPQQPPAPKRKKKRGVVVAVVLILIACIAGAGFAGANIYLHNLNQNLAGDVQEAEEVKEVLTAAPIEDDPFYMLLIGCDDREGVDGVRADTTILARLDPKKNRVTLLSIPRDTAIEIEGQGMQKFNAAYTFGGPSGTIAAAKELCGVDISHYAEVHFEALIDIIDYIGGVDVDVPIGIDDVDAGGKVEAGMQHLDGEHAMIFARSRSYTNGDFQRTTSQRLLIKAAAEKVLAMDPTEYPGLLMKISESMNTDFSVQELLGLAQAFTDEPEMKMYSALVPSTTDEIDGVSYVITDTDALAKMMAYIDKGKNPAKLEYEDTTVTSSKEAKKEGIETIINYGDEAEGTYVEGAYDNGYYDDGYYEEEYYDDGAGEDEEEYVEEEEYDEGEGEEEE